MHNIRRKAHTVIGLGTLLALGSPALGGATIDPRGVFFHSYTGPFSAVEWIDFRAMDGENRYQFSDIRGLAPYRGTISPAGQITWDTTSNSSGTGQFSDQDHATMTLQYFGGTYQSTMHRAPGTDAQFITQIESRTAGDTQYAGDWELTITELDARNGQEIGVRSIGATIAVTDDLVRMTYDDGAYYQGVFETDAHAGFRVVLPAGGLAGEFASFEGSETSLTQNLLGDLRFDDADHFSATFLTQTRAQPGRQDQFVYVISGSRAVPAPGTLPVVMGVGLLGARRRR